MPVSPLAMSAGVLTGTWVPSGNVNVKAKLVPLLLRN